MKPAGAVLEETQIIENTQEAYFNIQPISDALMERINGKSYKKDCTIPREKLRYLRILHRGFDGRTRIGELIVNEAVSEAILDIFFALYQEDYPIERVLLIDEYGADDEASMSDNNSSCFNFRTISHSTRLSMHSYGLAVDINPLYNPYLKTVDGIKICEPAAGIEYADRTRRFPYKITHNDLCYRLFTRYGFIWGGDWEKAKDYQHFEKTP